jgi:hypothetical protein
MEPWYGEVSTLDTKTGLQMLYISQLLVPTTVFCEKQVRLAFVFSEIVIFAKQNEMKCHEIVQFNETGEKIRRNDIFLANCSMSA